MASGNSHSINSAGLKKLQTALPEPSAEAYSKLHAAAPKLPELSMPLLVFVLPPSSFDDHFRDKQDYKDKGVRLLIYCRQLVLSMHSSIRKD